MSETQALDDLTHSSPVDRVSECFDEPVQETPLALSQKDFLSDLPQLLEIHRGKWVAYADGKRIKLANSQAELYRHCLNELKLSHDRFIVRRIVPESSPHIEYTLR